MTWTITHIASQDPGKTTPRIADERDQPVAYVLQPEHAKLIAAAPDLLEALKKLASIDFGSHGWDEFAESAAREARAAINKATQ